MGRISCTFAFDAVQVTPVQLNVLDERSEADLCSVRVPLERVTRNSSFHVRVLIVPGR